MQPDRVVRNGRYKFRIRFYTQDVSQSPVLDTPIVTPLLDLSDDFDPIEYCKEPPDITFRFLASKFVKQDTAILAHSSALGQSRYFTKNVNDAREEKARKDEPFTGLTCLIAEFSPAIFRAMLFYLYLGRLGLKSRSNQAERMVTASSLYSRGAEQMEAKVQRRVTVQERGVHFEDLYRISERYEIPKLKALSLKAMQCSLNMSIVIPMLADLPGEAARGLTGQNKKEQQQQQQQLKKMQIKFALDMIKDYIHFFGLEATDLANKDRDARMRLSVEDRVELIHYIGDNVLNNIARL